MEADFIPYQAISAPPAGNVLVLAPHPDDETFGCGGAIIRHVAQGDEVEVIVATDGREAQPQPDAARILHYIEARRQETRNAAHILGYKRLTFWDIPDRQLVCDEALIARLRQAIETRQIARVYAPSLWEIHPDHYALAQAALAAVSRCADQVVLAMYEIGVPLHPNLLLDISADIPRIRHAMSCYASQMALQAYDRHVEALHVYRSYTLPPGVLMAEAYLALSAAQLRHDPASRFGPNRHAGVLAAGLEQFN